MKYLMTCLVAAGLTIGSLAQNADARGPGGPGGHGRGPGPGGQRGGPEMMQMMAELDLTPEQRKKLQEVRKDNRDKMQSLQEQVRTSQEKLKEALASGTAAQELRKIHAQHEELRRKAADQRFEQILAVREILTPEQRKKFQELQAQRRGSGPGRGHGGPGVGEDDGE